MATNMSCDRLSKNLLADYCNKAPVSGIGDALYLIPIEDIDDTLTTYDTTNDLMVTNLVMLASKHGYKLTGRKFSNEAMCELVKGTYLDQWKHTLKFKVLEHSIEAKQWVEALKNTKVVAVVEVNTTSSNKANAFMILGLDNGLDIATAVADHSSADTKGGFDIAMESDEKALEAKQTRIYLKTDYATTKAALEALLPA